MIASLEASCRAHPGNEKLLYQLATAYLNSGRFDDRAVQTYRQAGEVHPGDAKIQRAVAISFMIGQGRALLRDVPSLEEVDPEALQRTRDQLAKLAEQYPESPEVHAAIADIELVRGEYRDALKGYRSALSLGLEDVDGICAHFEAMQGLFPLPPNVVAFFAELYQRIGQMDKAATLYHGLVEEGEDDPAILDAYYRFLYRRFDGMQNDTKALSATIREICTVALMMEKTDEALSWARQLRPEQLAAQPELVKRLGRLLIDREDFRQAFDYLSKTELDGETKSLLNEIAVLLEQRGELDTAVYLLQFINEHDTLAREGRRETKRKADAGAAEIRLAGPPKARGEDWEIEINTELQLAELHWKSRRWKQAFESYLKVLEMGYDDYRALLEPLDSLLERLPDIDEKSLAFLANFFAKKRDWRRTLFYAERALFLDPTLDDIRQRLIQACEQILLQDPDSCEVRLKLGDVALEKGNVERAMKEYRKVAGYPEFGMKANRRIALALFRAGDVKAAFQKYQELPVLETEDLEHLYDIMIGFQNGEQWKLAMEAATTIKEYDANFRDISAKIAVYEEKMAAAGAEFFVDPKMRELIGDHSIGRYKYVEKIGSGGMGVVHKVVDLKTNTEVAMKILREGLSGSDKAIDRFFREARIAATLHHRNIVNILDYNISNFYGQSYIAMEFVDGPSLRDIVEDKFSRTVDVDLAYVLDVVDWMMQVCEALDATHRKGIIHRDIKPDNIMLDPNGIIKLTDFGIVHIEEATFTPTGALIGTPRYMSPEQVHGGRIDARSDIYSVGIILYEMLIGSPPFISGDISYQQVNVLPTPPREICGAIPECVDAITMRCLEKNPADRFQSTMDLKASLQDGYLALGGDPKKMHQTHGGSSDRVTPGPQRKQTSETVDLKRGRPEPPPLAPARPAPPPPAPAAPPPPIPAGKPWGRPDTEQEYESELDLDTGTDEYDRQDRLVGSTDRIALAAVQAGLVPPGQQPLGSDSEFELGDVAAPAPIPDPESAEFEFEAPPARPVPAVGDSRDDIPKRRIGEKVAGMFDSEFELGENLEEDETAPLSVREVKKAMPPPRAKLPSKTDIEKHSLFRTHAGQAAMPSPPPPRRDDVESAEFD